MQDPMSKGIATGALRDADQEQRIAALERQQPHDRRHGDQHEILQDAQMRSLLVSVATLTDQVAEIVVAQHKAARDLDAKVQDIEEIKATVKRNSDTAQEVLQLFETLKGGFKVLGWLGAFARGVGGLAAAAAAIWGLWIAFKHGAPK